ncbi:hypothetical protein P692DRAFT_20734836, partial [Suillus brevipes Sb2]
DILLTPWHPLIHGVAESYLWLFSCSTLINNPTFFVCLQQAVIEQRMTATIGFNAVHFQPSFTTHLLLAFAELIIIEHFPILTAFPEMLGQSYKLGRHSDVFLLMPDNSGSLAITKYSWTHSVFRLWGQCLPIQCPQCGWFGALSPCTRIISLNARMMHAGDGIHFLNLLIPGPFARKKTWCLLGFNHCGAHT